MLLPPGTWLIESAVFNTSSIANCSTGGVTGGYGSGSIVGFGQTVSLLAPTPNFSAASCTGGASGTGCMLSGASGNLANLGVYGAGQSAIGAGFNGKIGIDFSGANNSNNYIYNLGLFSWGATTTGFTGIKFEAMSGSSATNMINDGFGRTGCVVAMPGITNMVTFENSYCAVNGLASLVISSGNFTSHQGVYGFTATTSNVSTVQCLSTAICNFDGDFVPYQTGIGSPQMIVEQTATMYLHNVYVLNGSGTNFCVATFGGGTLYVRDSTISCTTASAAILTQTTGKTFLEGGNTVNGPIKNTGTGITYFNTQDTYTTALDASVFPTCTFTSGGGTSPSCALQAGSTNEKGIIIATTGTGAPGTTGTVTLTFAGTYTGATGAAPACTVSPDDSGTAWGNGALAKVSTQSTTAPVFAWSNSAANVLTALAVSSPFRMDYTCTAR
jgi:hypothetical protein